MIYLLPLLVGFAITTSVIQNGTLAKHIGLKNTTLMNFVTGFTGAILLFIFTGHTIESFYTIGQVPILGFIGGLLGVCVVILSSLVVTKIPVIASTMLMYIGQLVAGVAIDMIRGVELAPLKVFGFAFIIAGFVFNTKVDMDRTVPAAEN